MGGDRAAPQGGDGGDRRRGAREQSEQPEALRRRRVEPAVGEFEGAADGRVGVARDGQALQGVAGAQIPDVVGDPEVAAQREVGRRDPQGQRRPAADGDEIREGLGLRLGARPADHRADQFGRLVGREGPQRQHRRAMADDERAEPVAAGDQGEAARLVRQ